MKKIILLALFLIPLLNISIASANSDRNAAYSQWESYGASWKHTLIYPDFTLTFIDKVDGPFFPGSTEHRMSPIYSFQLNKNANGPIVKWSSGTGDIGPVAFTVDGKKFYLEMLRSDLVDDIVPDHKVLIWTEEEFNKRMEVRKIELDAKLRK